MLPTVTLRCLLIDDSIDMLRALRTLLEREGLEVVGSAATAAEGIRQAGALAPDVILLDVDLGEDSGVSVARDLAAAQIVATVIFISTHQEYRELAVGAGAAGFISKAELSRHAIENVVRDAARPTRPPGSE